MPSLPIPVFASVVLFFLFLKIWVARGRLSPIAILLAVCAVQTAIIALAQHYQVAGMRYVQPVTATLIPPVAWCAFQWTAARPMRKADWVHALVPVTALAALATAPDFLDILLPATFILYGCAIVLQCSKGPDAQPRAFLSDGDLPSRVWQIIGVALIVSALSDGLIIVAIVLGYGHLQPWIISIFTIGNLLLIGIVSLSSHLQTEESNEEGPTRANIEIDDKEWHRVQAYMVSQKPFLDPDLTLIRLSRKLGIPAKTLSTLINRKTSQNVSRYVNGARIAAAQEALLAGEPVTTAMLSSGFNTKSNFNREFLRVTNDSPRKWLAKNQPPSQIPTADNT